jgi:hypothetical protein
MDRAATTSVDPKSKEKLSQAGQSKKGTNDISHTGTMSPVGSPSPVKGNRPAAWPAAHER